MLSAVFCWNVPDLCSTSVIRDLIRSFTIRRSVARGGFPPFWDLNFVLRAVLSPPYEPLGQASFRNLTRKYLFFLSLATV